MFSTATNIEPVHGSLEVHENSAGQKSLYATRSFKSGEVILPFSAASRQNHPTYLTVQLDDELHIMLSPMFLQYVNHSCNPNSFFDTTRMEFVALADISKGQELTFFYPSTEWKMNQPFACHCSEANCLGIIKGAAYLSEKQVAQYRFTAYIERKLRERHERFG